MKIGMIGGKTSTLGFKALGVETFPVIKPSEAPEVWERIDIDEFGVIFITEPIYEVLSEVLQPVRERLLPTINIIPAVAGGRDVAEKELRKLVEKAVGTDLAF